LPLGSGGAICTSAVGGGGGSSSGTGGKGGTEVAGFVSRDSNTPAKMSE
jgi:hypothetical protein